jgi:hypothetical protein
MSISEPFVRRSIGTTPLAAGLLVIGVVSFPLLPVAPLPQVDYPTIQVSASLPGASAETMAASVTTPLERQFSLIAGVTELTSASSLGSSSITVQFDLNRDIDAASSDIQSVYLSIVTGTGIGLKTVSAIPRERAATSRRSLGAPSALSGSRECRTGSRWLCKTYRCQWVEQE